MSPKQVLRQLLFSKDKPYGSGGVGTVSWEQGQEWGLGHVTTSGRLWLHEPGHGSATTTPCSSLRVRLHETARRRRRDRNGFHCFLWDHLHVTVPAPLPSMASALSTVCHAHWVLYPFIEGAVDGIFAMDGTGAIAMSCKRALTPGPALGQPWLLVLIGLTWSHDFIPEWGSEWGSIKVMVDRSAIDRRRSHSGV